MLFQLRKLGFVMMRFVLRRCVDASCVLSSGEAVALVAVLRRLMRAGAEEDGAGAPVIYAQAEHAGLAQRVCTQVTFTLSLAYHGTCK